MDNPIFEWAQNHLARARMSGPENLMAVCPFHTKGGAPEKNPSFALSLTSGLWFCHACHAAGNFRQLLKDFGMPGIVIDTTFGFILEQLNQTAKNKKTSPFLDLDLDAEPLDESMLGLFDDKVPLLLEQEGFTEDTMRHFEVGVDEKSWRITFPLRDLLGRLIGISGRTMVDADPRYKVYDKAEYEAWGLPPRKTEKRHIMWNADKLYPLAAHSALPEVYVVEGFKACMWLWQAGLTNVVALLGSHMSQQQKKILERFGSTVYLFLDNDDAGREGMKKASRELSKSLSVRVVEYPAKQPTDLSPEHVLEAAKSSLDYLRWAISQRIEA